MEPTKEAQRTLIHARLRQTTSEERATWSAAIREHVLASPAWQSARTVMLYAALRYEPDLLPLFDAAGDKRLVLPGLENDRIVARQVRDLPDLELSPGGIREPFPLRCPAVSASEIDLVLIPGLAFARDGTRLGRGRGHYDRFLAGLPEMAIKCGVCFRCQVLPALPSEAHDVMVSLVLTEEGSLAVIANQKIQ